MNSFDEFEDKFSIVDVINYKKLTIEQFKILTNNKNVTDEMAEKTIESLYELSIIAYYINNK